MTPPRPVPAPVPGTWGRSADLFDLPIVADLKLVAHHEAGHAVLMEHFGAVGIRAHASAQGGECSSDREQVRRAAAARGAPDKLVSVLAASARHAGIVAESLFLAGRLPPGCVLWRPTSQDHQDACTTLADAFPVATTGPHWWAQQYAAHVLAGSWERVRAIAQQLIDCPGEVVEVGAMF